MSPSADETGGFPFDDSLLTPRSIFPEKLIEAIDATRRFPVIQIMTRRDAFSDISPSFLPARSSANPRES